MSAPFVRVLVLLACGLVLPRCSQDPTSAGHEGEARTETLATVGRAVLDDGSPAVDALIYLDTVKLQASDSLSPAVRTPLTTTDSNGCFRIDSLLPGSYLVEAVLEQDTVELAAFVEHQVTGDNPVDTLTDLVLAATGAIRGQILDFWRYPGLELAVTVLYQTVPRAFCRTDSTGAFSVTGVTAGTYRLHYAPLDSAYAPFTQGGVAVHPADTTVVVVTGLIHLGTLLTDSAYVRDSAAVRAILDSNGIDLPVSAVVGVSDELRVSQLLLAGQGVTRLPEQLSRLDRMEILDLRQNYLTDLPPAFADLGSLTALLLDGNQLSTVPLVVCSLSGLTTLRLSGNRISYLPGAIGNLHGLRELFLDDNRLTALPIAVGELDSLRNLALQYNALGSLPPQIGNLRALHTLSVQHNDLLELPRELGRIPNLVKLNLEGNALSRLPDTLTTMESLEYLSVRDNQLTALPGNIGALQGLRYLIVSGNSLTTLPADIVRLTALSQLLLDGNDLTTLPVGIEAIASLSGLSLANNRLCSLNSTQRAWADRCDPDWETSQRCGPAPPGIVTVLYPNGGDTVRLGDTVQVRWQVGDVHEVIAAVLLSTDEGETWVVISEFPINCAGNSITTFEWVVDPTSVATSSRCLIMVRDYADQFLTDMSDSTFSIVAP
ncbi:MAG: hypothetical protein GF331_24330 [Chitinivibrionales bacterium]|nr:hypothetical protein [Chitinivibrionales bacterium]